MWEREITAYSHKAVKCNEGLQVNFAISQNSKRNKLLKKSMINYKMKIKLNR